MTAVEDLLALAGSRERDTFEFLDELALRPEVRAALPVAIDRARENADWRGLQRMVLAVRRWPAPESVESLIRTLALFSEEMTNEDIVDALIAIGDRRAISVLREALNVDLNWDEFHQLNKKALLGLVELSADGGQQILREASHSRYQEIRDLAQLLLMQSSRS
jgi:hypothetical protein